MTWSRLAFIVLLLFSGLAAWTSWSFLPPRAFPTDRVIEIPAGRSLDEIAELLEREQVIASPLFFTVTVRAASLERGIQAGFYEFEKPLSALGLAERLGRGRFAAAPVKLTLAEGLNAKQVAGVIAAAFPALSAAELETLAETEQGYLFPDTYFLPPHAGAEMIIEALRRNFDIQTKTLVASLADSPRSLAAVVTMASIVEEEAARAADRRLIAGILWKRLEAGQRLEVDVATSTYEALGLPPAPIVNPSLGSLEAVVAPLSSQYWFYLSDKDGIIHYAKDYEEHKRNIARFY